MRGRKTREECVWVHTINHITSYELKGVKEDRVEVEVEEQGEEVGTNEIVRLQYTTEIWGGGEVGSGVEEGQDGVVCLPFRSPSLPSFPVLPSPYLHQSHPSPSVPSLPSFFYSRVQFFPSFIHFSCTVQPLLSFTPSFSFPSSIPLFSLHFSPSSRIGNKEE